MTNGLQMDALTALLEERRRYESWLAQLDARREAAPSHVVDRVRGDYSERLRGVMEQLRGRAADVERSVADLGARIAALLAEETTRRDERAETELRAAVGEFAADDAQQSLARSDEQISALVGERTSLAAEMTRLEDILSQVRTPPARPAPPAPPPAVAPEVPSALDTRPLQPPAPAPKASPNAFDELAFLQSVVQPRESTGATHPPAAHHPVADEPARAAAPHDYLPPPSLTATREARENVAPTRAASATPDGVASFFKDVPTEQVKTLKCQECGTMNYPTEWYCERCGGELAAL